MSNKAKSVRVNWSAVKRNDALLHNEQYIKNKAAEEKQLREKERVNSFITTCDAIGQDVTTQVSLNDETQRVGRTQFMADGYDIVVIGGNEIGKYGLTNLIDSMEPVKGMDFKIQPQFHTTYPRRYLERK